MRTVGTWRRFKEWYRERSPTHQVCRRGNDEQIRMNENLAANQNVAVKMGKGRKWSIIQGALVKREGRVGAQDHHWVMKISFFFGRGKDHAPLTCFLLGQGCTILKGHLIDWLQGVNILNLIRVWHLSYKDTKAPQQEFCLAHEVFGHSCEQKCS